MTSAARPAFDEVIHSPVRLRICGLLRSVSELEFALVRDTLELTDAHLSKNLRVLAEAGYVRVRKESSPGRADRRRLTWVGLTGAGRTALAGHLAALAEIAGGTLPSGGQGTGDHGGRAGSPSGSKGVDSLWQRGG